MRRSRLVAMTGDCKSPGVNLRKFESYLRHQIKNPPYGGFFIYVDKMEA